MSVPNREMLRDAFVTLLSAGLVGTGLPCKQVLSYPASRVDRSPTVLVAVQSARGERMAKASWDFHFVLELEVLVRWKDSGSWTQANAEDKLDEIWAIIMGILADNQITANWGTLQLVSDVCDNVIISGETYRREVIQVDIGQVRTG